MAVDLATAYVSISASADGMGKSIKDEVGVGEKREPNPPQVLEAVVRGSVAHIGLLNTEITNLELHLEGALAAHPKTVA